MVFLRIALLFGFTAALSAAASSEQLPVKTYTTADGLARDNVSRIFQDSRGFLWFCTVDGLSRFDGYKFTNYDTDQGLPHRVVNDLLETRGGLYWVATGDGLVRFNPSGTQSRDVSSSNPQSAGPNPQSKGSMFVVYRPEGQREAWVVNVLLEDRAGTIWCGTDQGLYRLEQVDGRWALGSVDIGLPTNVLEADEVNALLEDRHGALWVGSESGLYRRYPDGRAERYTTRHGLPAAGISALNGVRALSEDAEGRLWAGTGFGLCRIVTDPRPDLPVVVAELYTLKDGLTNNFVNTLLESADGKLWIGTRYGLSEFAPEAGDGRPKFRGYAAAQGLSDVAVWSLAEDRAGNLWLGTETGGVMKIARNGFTSYQEVDGLGYPRVNSIFENGAGELYVVNGFSDAGGSDKLFISRFDGGRGFTSVRPNLPARVGNVGWGWGQVSFQDRAGEWWVATGEGLCRFPRVGRIEDLARTPPKRIYTTRDGLPTDEVFRLFEDSRGDIWISTLGDPKGMLTRWERSTETFHRYPPAAGSIPVSAPSAFGEDRSGNLWIGFYDGGLLRYRDNRFTFFTTRDGVPAGFVRGIHLDGAGRLWVATSEGGLGRLDDPAAERLRFVTYTSAEGLTSNFVTCVTEDRWGRIYVGTGRGVDRLDPATGRVKNYTTADGLVNNYVNPSHELGSADKMPA